MRKTALKLFAAGAMLAGAGRVTPVTLYVDVNSTNETPPYTNWATAASNIRSAVEAAFAGDEIVVTNGVYGVGGHLADGTTSRVFVDKPLSVRSVNGPQVTTIDGGGSVRCVYLIDGASLSGFTLTNGYVYGEGGGAINGTLNDCVLTGNSAHGFLAPLAPVRLGNGGGAAYSTLNNCTLTGNSADYATLIACDLSHEAGNGGGAYRCTLNNCTLKNNSAQKADIAGCPDNPGQASGGGAYGCTLNNCTLTGNSAFHGSGAYICTLNNCIRFSNSGDSDSGSPGFLSGNNWIGDPLFVDTNGWANLHLQSNSPCINAGNNANVVGTTDLDGNPRIAGGTVDLGAHEYQSPVSQISYAWLLQYGLLINTSTDTSEPDGDGVDNYHEWLAGTDPTSLLSSPAQLTATPCGTNVTITWSTNAVGFTLQSTTNLLSPAAWVTNSPAPFVINGQNTVTNPISGAQKFYRLIK